MRPTASWSRSSGAVRATASRSPSPTRGSARASSSQSRPTAPSTPSITPSSTPGPTFASRPGSRRGGGRLTCTPRAATQRRRGRAVASSQFRRPGGHPPGRHTSSHRTHPAPHTSLKQSKENITMFRSKRNSTKQPASTRTPCPQLRRPRRPVECKSLEDRRSRLARLRCRRSLGRQHDRHQADQAERGHGRRVPQGRPHPRGRQFTVNKNGESVEEQWESVLIQSKTLNVERSRLPGRDRRRREDARARSRRSRRCIRRARRSRPADLIRRTSTRRGSTSCPRAPTKRPSLYIDKIDAAVKKTGARHGDVSTESIGV